MEIPRRPLHYCVRSAGVSSAHRSSRSGESWRGDAETARGKKPKCDCPPDTVSHRAGYSVSTRRRTSTRRPRGARSHCRGLAVAAAHRKSRVQMSGLGMQSRLVRRAASRSRKVAELSASQARPCSPPQTFAGSSARARGRRGQAKQQGRHHRSAQSLANAIVYLPAIYAACFEKLPTRSSALTMFSSELA